MDIEIKNSDFERLLFPVNLLKSNVNPLKFFPKLQKWSEFTAFKGKITDFNKIFRWIVLTYDMNSPFRKIDDVIQRKFEVAKYVRLIEVENNIDESVKKILLNKDTIINRMIIAYARMHRESKYSLIIGLEHKFYEDLYASQNGIRPSTPIETTQRNLENAITDFLSKDNSVTLKKAFYEYIEEERLDNIRPEDIARLLSEGKQPISEKEIAD